MVPLADIIAFVRDAAAEWQSIRVAELLFGSRDAARLTLIVLLGGSAAVLLARSLFGRGPGRGRIALPALLPVIRSSPFSFVRHTPVLLFLLGLPFFILALADPFTRLTQQEVSFPGRRIGLLVDASSSMMQPFEAPLIGADSPSNAAFFTAVDSAQTFVRKRMDGRFRDLIALIEFGDEAYVITPFTNDYENILLSISLIDDLAEFNEFPDQGTTIGTAINQAVRLFTAFNFMDASGNLMVIFSDGEDTKTSGPRLAGLNIDQILNSAVAAKIPVYFVRTSFNKDLGRAFTDPLWQSVVEKTGGKFYAAANETAILRAIADIDRAATGRIVITEYSSQQTRFAIFALLAVGLWTLALALKLTVPYFRKFP